MFYRLPVLGLALVMCALFSPAATADVESTPREPFITIKVMGKSMEEAVADLKRAIVDHNYVFVRQQALDMGLVSKADEEQNVLIVYFCNFGMLNDSLKVDKHVGIYLPCRVTMIRERDGILLLVENPKFLDHKLNDGSLSDICDQLAADYKDILSEVALL